MTTPDVAAELRLLIIAGPPVVPLDRLVASCRAAVDGGATAVQLRVKAAGAGRVLALAEQLVAELAVPVWVNDRADVALAAGARGVHVGQDDAPPAAVRAMAGDRLLIGISAGNEAEAAVARAAPVDYWSVGSVFRTGTKPDAGEPIGVEEFAALRHLAPPRMPVLAIGGITADRVSAVTGAGATGVAVSSAVLGAPDIAGAAGRFREALDAALGDV